MKKILFVEDDALVARIYSQKLTESGFEVAVAEDGLVAMKRMPEFKPDLVVLDLLMPRMTGLDVIKFMHQRPEIKSTPVIVLSNSFLNRLGEEVAALGVEEMLAKPAVTPAVLIETITRVLQKTAASPASAPAPKTRSSGSRSITATASANPSPAPAAPGLKDLDPTYRNESAATFRKRIRRDFFEQIPAITKGVQQACQEFQNAVENSAHTSRLEGLNRKLGFITHMTAMAACYRISQLSSALEALVFELQEKPAGINESTRNTIATTVALLSEWLSRADQPDEQCLSPTTILIVDDDAVSNRALVFALSRVQLAAKSVTDPFKALEKLRENSYDAVLLDINLPGISGLALCERMRELPLHKQTPIIFMSSYSEFEPRARELSNAGDDFIAKPIMPIELTVKVTAHVLKRRLTEQSVAR
jgi:CheY-like chemotaxis protein